MRKYVNTIVTKEVCTAAIQFELPTAHRDTGIVLLIIPELLLNRELYISSRN